MPYVITISTHHGAKPVPEDFLVFGQRRDAENFCRSRNTHERRRRGLLHYAFREISRSEADQHLAASQASDRRP